MPGLVAILTPVYSPTLANRVVAMAELMCHEDFHRMDVFNDRSIPCTIALVHSGIINVEVHPICNEDRCVFVFLEGEIYAREELIREIRSSQYESNFHFNVDTISGGRSQRVIRKYFDSGISL
jgi:predicted ATPase